MTAPDLLPLLHERVDALPPVKLVLTDHVRVPFTGSRGGDGPLTIVQATGLTWVISPAFPARMIEWPFYLPAGTSLAGISAALQVLMARYESLRTRYPLDPAAPDRQDGKAAPSRCLANGGIVMPESRCQRVERSGELLIDVYAVSDKPADDALVAIELTRLLRSREFDLAADLPLRVAVATWQGAPRTAVILYSHMAIDFASLVILDRQFMELIRDPASRQVGPSGYQPLDQAADERSPRGLRRMDAAVRGWQAALRTKPQCLYAVPSRDQPRCGDITSGWLWSRAGALALPHVSARTGASPQHVVFAALCTMIGWRTGHDRCVLNAHSANRYQPHLRDCIGHLSQDSIPAIDLRAQSFEEVVRRTSAAVLRGSRSSLIDIAALDRLIEQTEHQRGITHARYCTYNDISLYQQPDPAASETGSSPADARQALHQTRFGELPAPLEDQLLRLMLTQVAGELVISATTRDTNRVPLGEMETLLRGTEALLVTAAAGDVELSRIGEITGVQPIARGPGWLRIDSSWIELAEVQRLVADALPAPAAVFTEPGPDGEPSLVVYLAAQGGMSTPEQAHAACMTMLAGDRTLVPPGGIRYTAMAPGHYTLCAGAPGNPHDLAAWRRQTVVAQGNGRRPPSGLQHLTRRQ
jgi:hypothetical protein